MSTKILLIDDDPMVLGSYRQLQNNFDIIMAAGGIEGLRMIQEQGPFGVIVSDMRMPEMDGLEFLKKARKLAPDSVRMMLTGLDDQKTASDVVNEGYIFRFLSKPCSPDSLAVALAAGLSQFQLVTAEKELLTKTLTGGVKILTEVLSLVNPTAFGNATRIRNLTCQICEEVDADNAWEIEIASILSQVGCITLSESTLAKRATGTMLSEEELQAFQNHPQIGCELTANIPRLEGVTAIIAYQQKHFDGSGVPSDEKQADEIPLGARVLKLVIDAVQLIGVHKSSTKVVHILRERHGWYDPTIVNALETVLNVDCDIRSVGVHELKTGMILDEHLTSVSGSVLVTQGSEVTPLLTERIKRYKTSPDGIREPIRVRCPAYLAQAHHSQH